MILTSNRGFAEWGEVFGDPVVATALLDRLLHHAVVIQIEGSSYRLRQHVDLVLEHWRRASPCQAYGHQYKRQRDVSAVVDTRHLFGPPPGATDRRLKVASLFVCCSRLPDPAEAIGRCAR